MVVWVILSLRNATGKWGLILRSLAVGGTFKAGYPLNKGYPYRDLLYEFYVGFAGVSGVQ